MAWAKYEVDFLPVGSGERSGDAIAARFYDDTTQRWTVMAIDGGTKDSGQALVEHISTYYGTSHVDHVVNSHPDADHASGLRVVLEQCTVGRMWMHRPWEHSADIRDMFHDGRLTDNSLSDRIKEALSGAYELEELAYEKGIMIEEPFAGAKIGPFTVLSPSLEFYQQLLPDFRSTPDAAARSGWAMGIAQKGTAFATALLARVAESWNIETLREGGTTSAENESSVVMYGIVGGNGILLNGDAGLQALEQAMDYADLWEHDRSQLRFVQIPHHGSRNNVSPSLLDRLIGPIFQPGSSGGVTAFVSTAEKSETHPRKAVVNAFIRRGCTVIATNGSAKCRSHPPAHRPGWIAASPLPISYDVEDYD